MSLSKKLFLISIYIFSYFLFVLMDSIAKYLSEYITTSQIVWGRYFFHMVLMMIIYFFISKATNVPLTHVDGEKHKIQGTNENLLKRLIKTASPKNVILSSDCGVSILPKPYIGFSKFINQIIKLGFSKKEIEYMIKINSKKLFRL